MHPNNTGGPPADAKQRQMDAVRTSDDDAVLTTTTGVRPSSTDDSLKAGTRGPTLLEDFHFREKMTSFDHERIPERAVHARGSGAYGHFEAYESLADLTKASVFAEAGKKTPVFVRFSTVAGERGSADTVRDARGFAVKFYTDEGNWDLVGNNIPVFFIQDAIKFPDLVHAIKPEPHHAMPQASAAHDTFWDFISLMPESAHMIMWALSDRALPRSYRMMDGFGVHTFRFVNAEGRAHFVKFHWRATLGAHALVWDETQKIAGKDPDFNRRDLWEAIDRGDFPEWELGVQVVPEEDEHRFDFDLLDATKIIPESDVPVRIVGKMTLTRNVDNFFAETEQAAFHPGHVVSGIDFTNDPLLQGRLFSYLDTQLIRLGGPNFNELPVNRPVAPVHHHQRDGYGRQTVHRGRVAYSPNSLGGGCPVTAGADMSAFVHHAEKVEGHKVRARSESFGDHFSQATMFWNSLTDDERDRLVEAGQFELGKVEAVEIRERMVHEYFNRIAHELAVRVAEGIGVEPPAAFAGKEVTKQAPEVSLRRTIRGDTIRTRQVAVLLAEGFDAGHLSAVRDALKAEGAQVKLIAKIGGMLRGSDGESVKVDATYMTTASVVYDAVFVPGGASAEAQKTQGAALHFLSEAYKHGKPVAATGEAIAVLSEARLPGVRVSDGALVTDKGVVTSRDGVDGVAEAFVEAMKAHRHFDRPKDLVSA